MEFLKDALDEQLYVQVVEKLRSNDRVKLANLAEGQYVAKYKFDKLERKFKETAAELYDLKKIDIAALKAENENLKHQIAAIGKGIPAAKAEKCVKLAESYVTEKIGFAAALDLMLKDFPLPTGPGTPGLGKKAPIPDPNMQQTQGLILEGTTGVCLTAEMNKTGGEPGMTLRLVIDPAH